MGGLSGEGEGLLKGRPLFLLGFMGVGKSTVGPLLARVLGCPFLDLDTLIEEWVGKDIETIFREKGEEWFRIYETQALMKVASEEAVIATGGGVVTREENWRFLERGLTVALVASPEELALRLASGEGRPLLKGERDWRSILEERASLYRRAWLVVDTTELTPGEVVDAIVKALKGEAS